MTTTLVDRLGIGSREVAAFVGGGGKSSLVLGLGRELAQSSRPVVMATTTKMGVDQIPPWAKVCQETTEVESALRSDSPVYLLRRAESEKVIGVDPLLVDEIAEATTATVLIEADGSRGRPFKAPADHEPVIPASVTLVVVVVGVDAIGKRIIDICHRPERVAALTGRLPTEVVRAEDVAAVYNDPLGGGKNVPPGARSLLALTKVEERHSATINEIRTHLLEPTELVTIAKR